MRKLIFILFVLFSVVLSWGACRSDDYGNFSYLGCSTQGGCWYCETNSVGRVSCDNPDPLVVPNCIIFQGSGVPSNRYLTGCTYSNGQAYLKRSVCDTPQDADSLQCVNNGDLWVDAGNGVKECQSNQCDTTMNCITYPYNYCNDVDNDLDITCVNGNCWGIGGAKWVSYYDRNCSNECGTTETTRVSGDTVFVPGGSCDDPVNCDPTIYCSDFENGTYFLYQVCLIGREVVGNVDERQTMTQITYSGVGTCKDNGYSSKTYPNSGGGNTSPHQSQPDSISTECVIYGVGCEQYQDTTDYSNGNNANPSKCWCEPFDGSNAVSYIKCPDGSSRIVYMSCDEWQNWFSSSSTTPPPSSGSGGGGASSGSTGSNSSDSNPFRGKYPEYPSDQPTTNKNVQGALSGISEMVISIRDHLAQLKNYIMSTQSVEFDTVPTRSYGDYSQLDTVQSDLGFTFDSLFNKIDTSRKIIDTSSLVSTGTCPIIKGEFSLCKKFGIFKGNKDVDLEFDLSNFFGFNLCSIIKALVLGFTSVVVFILSFRVISKSGM